MRDFPGGCGYDARTALVVAVARVLAFALSCEDSMARVNFVTIVPLSPPPVCDGAAHCSLRMPTGQILGHEEGQTFSAMLLLPFIATTLGLLRFNW